MDAFLLPDLDTLPFHGQLMLGVIAGSVLLCLLTALLGSLRHGLLSYRVGLPEGLPPLPRDTSFPTIFDQLFTAFFLLFILYSSVMECWPSEPDEQELKLGWGAALAAIVVQGAIYIPMLVRYAIVYPPHRPTRPLHHYLLLPLVVWAGIFALAFLCEAGGLPELLTEKTGCPENQQVVELFSAGSVPLQVYIAFSAIVIAPVGEEICFRGFLFKALKRHGGFWPAAIASGLLFGAIHSSLAQMLPLTIFGIAQCIAYERARSLWLPMAVHAIFNTVSLITTYFFFP